MNIFSCSNLSKSIKERSLFENISFGLEYGERIGIIGPNGTGKSSLLKIIAGLAKADNGETTFNKGIKIEYLAQESDFNSSDTALEVVMKSKPELFKLLSINNNYINKTKLTDIEQEELSNIHHRIDELNGWNLENEAKKYLHKLGIDEYSKLVSHMSGGQKKRVAIARILMTDAELMILDEPTNHLDVDSVQWLQDLLKNFTNSVIFVTHDRYFLDAVATSILELDKGKIIKYPGNYEEYLSQKESYERVNENTLHHNLMKLRSELAWLQKGAKARRTKQKSRIDWIDELKKSSIKVKEKKIEIELGKIFLGNKIIEASYITKYLGDKLLFKDFVYFAKPKDRIGIIGLNGTGKSTLLNVLSGNLKPDDGNLEIGGSVNIGYFTQENIELKGSQTVIGTLREIAEFIDVGVGRDRYISVRELLQKFLFPVEKHHMLVENLSGGEKRRLALLRILMKNPNILLLDEPTNDFDIQTLNALESYLDDFYGVLIVVSHDRAFLDRTIEFIWSFENNGKIKEYPGNYSYYLEAKESRLKQEKNGEKPLNQAKPIAINKESKKKLSFSELKELNGLMEEIEKLEEQKKALEEEILNSSSKDYKELERLSSNFKDLNELIESKSLRWLELEEKRQVN
ncbi:MAG TPA: ABC-F family ATP-binding cassette domain-containing protein [Candidatus Kapabacteria bacterium]|nr:ABC-F family ATP-binding cassette domain-containing protein [Candidatus Kapabacteria bacterium]